MNSNFHELSPHTKKKKRQNIYGPLDLRLNKKDKKDKYKNNHYALIIVLQCK